MSKIWLSDLLSLGLGDVLDSPDDSYEIVGIGSKVANGTAEFTLRATARGSNTARQNDGRRRRTKVLDEDKVRAIRANPEGKTQRELAAQYGVSAPLISQIIMRKEWKHVE